MPAKNLTRSLHRPSAAKLFSPRLLAVLALSTLTLASGGADRLWPRHMRVSPAHRHLAPRVQGRHVSVPISSEVACAELASFDDQLTAVPRLDRMVAHGFIAHYELVAWTRQDLAFAQQQSRMFENAYNLPTERRLETLPSFQLLPALADFLVFKSQTDWRVVGQNTSAPQPLTHRQALRLASDILDVAHFYNLPLDYFLGVGAMENNYMDVNGDLTHAVWKKTAERGDIVLERGRKRVLVSDYSIGTWQISRETLRAAHQLYLKDKRHYDQLPLRLRPARELDVNSVDSEVLTTYAGLVLRDLLDRFDGNVDQAIGAYNGGVRNPNPAYAAGVKNVALYARRVLEHAPLPAAKSPAGILQNGTVL